MQYFVLSCINLGNGEFKKHIKGTSDKKFLINQ